MAFYRVQLKQGSKTVVTDVECKDTNSVLNLFKLSTMEVTEICEVVYQSKYSKVVDDFKYANYCKFIAYNKSSNKSRQYFIRNIKLSFTKDDIINSAIANLEIDGLKVDSVLNIVYSN